MSQEYTKEVIDSRLVDEFNATRNYSRNKLLYNKLLHKNYSPRDLLSLCGEEYERQQDNNQLRTGFALVLNGNVICRYGIDKKVGCPYQDSEKDHSGLYQCSHPDIMKEYENVLKLANAENTKRQ